jgi:hypothetical protein
MSILPVPGSIKLGGGSQHAEKRRPASRTRTEEIPKMSRLQRRPVGARGLWPGAHERATKSVDDADSATGSNAVADPRCTHGRPRRFVIDPKVAEHGCERVLARGGIELDRRVQLAQANRT